MTFAPGKERTLAHVAPRCRPTPGPRLIRASRALPSFVRILAMNLRNSKALENTSLCPQSTADLARQPEVTRERRETFLEINAESPYFSVQGRGIDRTCIYLHTLYVPSLHGPSLSAVPTERANVTRSDALVPRKKEHKLFSNRTRHVNFAFCSLPRCEMLQRTVLSSRDTFLDDNTSARVHLDKDSTKTRHRSAPVICNSTRLLGT